MPQFNKRGNRIRASDKSLVFRFGGYAAEPKVNHHYGLESNLTFSRWQRPFDNHAIQDNDYRCGGSGLCAGCPFLSQIPV